ncbi:BTB/POZ domain-containing protein 9-like [Dysidea avara]|uniref:BTB/POZ domain-containing protein 9-like n=1 Tax=Dysidea avara TaxID=196820 RepID=UPI00331AA8A3
MGARSPVFHAMLYGNTKERNEREIELPTVDTEILKMVIGFIYTGQMWAASSDQCLDLLQAAHYFDVDVLQDMCTDMIAQSLDVHNYCRFFTIAVEKQFQILSQRCLEFMEENAHEVIRGTEFNSLPFQALTMFFSSSNLEVREVDLFFAIMEWSKQQKDNLLEEDAQKMFKLIRYPLMQVSDLLEKVSPTNMADPDLYKAALEYHLMPENFTGSPEQTEVREFYFDFYEAPDMQVSHTPKGTLITHVDGGVEEDSEVGITATTAPINEQQPILFKVCVKNSNIDSVIKLLVNFKDETAPEGSRKPFSRIRIDNLPIGKEVDGLFSVNGDVMIMKIGENVAATSVRGKELGICVSMNCCGDQLQFTRV